MMKYMVFIHRSGVYVFKSGMDIDFDDLPEKEQQLVLNLVLSKDWKVNKYLQ